MPGDETRKGERRETVRELLELFAICQEMGHRLAYETHGDSYDLVRELNELLHRSRKIIEQIQRAAVVTGKTEK